MSTQPVDSLSDDVAVCGQRLPTAFVVAWLFRLLFYLMESALRSAPSRMLPELTTAFG